MAFSGLPYIYKEGTLVKRQRALHHKSNAKLKFQERYFQLKGDNLDYYDAKKKLSSPAKGTFCVRRAKIVEEVPYSIFKRSHVFQVGDDAEVMYLVASSDFELESWLKALRQACHDHKVEPSKTYHPGVYGLTAKNHWSCCGASKEIRGCMQCSKLPEPEPPDKESSLESSKEQSLNSSSQLSPSAVVIPATPPSRESSQSSLANGSASKDGATGVEARVDLEDDVVSPKPSSSPVESSMYTNPLLEVTKKEQQVAEKSKNRHSIVSNDSGTGTGSTSSSRSPSQIISDSHAVSGGQHSTESSPNVAHLITSRTVASSTAINSNNGENYTSAQLQTKAKSTSGLSSTTNASSALQTSSGNQTAEGALPNRASLKKQHAVDSTTTIDSSAAPLHTATPSNTTVSTSGSASNSVSVSTIASSEKSSGVCKAVTSPDNSTVNAEALSSANTTAVTTSSPTVIVSPTSGSPSTMRDADETDGGVRKISGGGAIVRSESPILPRTDAYSSSGSADYGNLIPSKDRDHGGDEEEEKDDVFLELPTGRSSHAMPQQSPKAHRMVVSQSCLPTSIAPGSPRMRRSSFSVGKVVKKTQQLLGTENPLVVNKDGFSGLHLACKNGDTAAIQKEIDSGADVEMATEATPALRPIFLAYLHDHYLTVEYLLMHCQASPVATESTNGATLLHWASESGNMSLCRLLIDCGGEVDKTDWKGRTPLFDACKHGQTEVVEILAQNGANIDAQDINKRTALHEAAQHGHYNTVKLLLEKGADQNIRETLENHTPAELAFLAKQLKVYGLLAPAPEEDSAPYELLSSMMQVYPEGISALTFCKSTDALVIASKDHQVSFWDIQSKECQRKVALDNTILSIAAHDSFVAIGSTTIQIMSTHSESWRRSVMDTDEDYEAIVEDLALHVVGITPCGHLVTADVEDENATIKIWPVISESQYLRTYKQSFSTAMEGKSTTYTMAVSQVASADSVAVVIQPGSLFSPVGNKQVRVFNWKTCKHMQTIDTGCGGFDIDVIVKFSTTNPNHLAVACANSIRIHDPITGDILMHFSSAKDSSVTSLVFSANGRQLCVGLESGMVQVFNLISKAQQFVLEDFMAPVACMQFSHSGDVLAIGTSIGDVQLWQVKSKTLST